MIDISKLPAPAIVEELSFETILAEMRTRLLELLPAWTASDLESDPANKILEVAAYRETLLRQRVNEAVRACMIAYATGTNLDNIAADCGVARLAGAQATFAAALGLSTVIDQPVTVPAGFTVVSSNGDYSARLMNDVLIPAGQTSVSGLFEMIAPIGEAGNALSLSWRSVTPLPFVVDVTQTAASSGGSDEESDEAFRLRAPLAMERFSTAGPDGAYEYWTRSADERIKDVKVLTPEPGKVLIVLLSSEGDGAADEAMVERVKDKLTPDEDDVRPLDDLITVQGAEPLDYAIKASLELYAGTATSPAYTAAVANLTAKAKELRRIGADIARSALIAAAHVEGVKRVTLTEPAADITVTDKQFARCAAIEVTSSVAEED